MMNEDRPIEKLPSDDEPGWGLPERPPAPDDSFLERKPEPKKSAARAVATIAVVLALVVVALGAVAFLTAEPAKPIVVAPSPSVSVAPPSSTPSPEPTRTITQSGLDAKMERAAFYLGRGQAVGANQVLNDFISGTTCEQIFANTATFSSQAEAERQRLFFKSQAKKELPQAFVGAAVAQLETYSLSGRWLLVGLILDCP